MAKKQFKAESKRLMDLMINSIYTNKEIFLRELISNASDAIDKLHYKSLTDKKIKVNKKDFCINIEIDKENRLLKISDNGIGMTKEELENNLGTIAKSGSLEFKENNEKKKDIDIIGQFGVGFYSAFMVADKIEVVTKAYGEEEAYKWVSSGVDGYEIKDATKDTYGTEITLTIKESSEEFDYDEFLFDKSIENLIQKYSNYITYPIRMEVTDYKFNEDNSREEHTEEKVVNDMIPLWKRNKSKITEREYNTFYSDKFFDYNDPISVIHTSAEGLVSYNSLLFIPSKAPFDYYTKNYEKGLQLYSNGVLIMEKCSELLPDYLGFVKGVVDSEDLSLNISREMLQQDKTLKTIAKSIETKILKELERLLEEDRDKYIKFFDVFGPNLRFGCYDNFGMNKDKLKDLLLFKSSKTKESITLKEYIDEYKSDKIYYVCGENLDKIDSLPVVENYKDKDILVLYCTDYMDEFVLKTLEKYEDKEFINISNDDDILSTDEEKEELAKTNEESSSILSKMKGFISDVTDVKFTNKLKNHPVCLTSIGDVSIEMEKVINAMPTDETIKAEKVLEINANHPIAETIKNINDDKELEDITKILYAQARLIEGLPIDNPTEITNLICNTIANKKED